MRNIIVTASITLDGVMQGMGGPNEDKSGNFRYGGWSVPYADEASGKAVICPVILGEGKKLFKEGKIAKGFILTEHLVTEPGVILAWYKRGGEVRTGTYGA